MVDYKLRSLEIIKQMISVVARSSGFWRRFNKLVLPATEFEGLLKRLVDEIPVDLKKASDMLEEKEGFREEAIAEREKVVDDAIEEAGKLVSESEIIARARAISQTMRDESDKYVVESLESLEDQIAQILSRIKKAQSELIADMESRRKVDSTERSESEYPS